VAIGARSRGRPHRPHLLKPGSRKAWRYLSITGHESRPPCQSRHHYRSHWPTAPPIRPAGPKRRQTKSSCCNLASALPQAEPCANRVVTTRCQPVVTTRKWPQPSWADHRQQLVTARSDELKARRIRRPCNAICYSPLSAGHVSRGATWRTRSPGTRAQPDEPTCRSKRHRCQCRVPRRPERQPRHKTGVVSRVPCGSRNAQAFGTDRNTNQTSTHQRRRRIPRATDAQEGTQQQENDATKT
jgi:hypothetical protein